MVADPRQPLIFSLEPVLDMNDEVRGGCDFSLDQHKDHPPNPFLVTLSFTGFSLASDGACKHSEMSVLDYTLDYTGPRCLCAIPFTIGSSSSRLLFSLVPLPCFFDIGSLVLLFRR